MAIRRLIQNTVFGPKDIASGGGYELTLRALCLKDRDDLITQLVAEKKIEDPAEISKLALKELGLSSWRGDGLSSMPDSISQVDTRR